MKMRTPIAAAAALTLFAALPAHAQSNPELEALRQELRQLRQELDTLKKQPAAERVQQVELKQKDAVVAGDIPGGFRLPGSETTIRVYGHAEAHVVHDFKQPGPSDVFTDLMFQPIDGTGPNGKTKLTAQSSRFGFETATPTAAGTFATKLEMDFYSYGAANRNRLRLRHAYGEYAGFLVGQTWSTFMDLDNLPETVDFNGPIGSPFSRRTMVRYTYNDPQIAKFTFALEDPEDQFGGGSANERMPQIVARVDKSFDWGALNLRGLAHEKRSATQTKRGFGVGIGGSFKLSDKDLLMAQYARVDGDIDQMYGSNGYAIDAATGVITFDKNQGLIVGYAKTFSDRLRGNLVLGLNRAKTAQAVDNRRLRQLHVNLIYSPTKSVELGAEYIHGQRKTFADETGTMSRFDLMGRYSF